ncbi:MAG: hypothetical protein ACTH2Q_00445 [Propionibacteriaceae bacterium]
MKLHPLDLGSGRTVLQAWLASRGLICIVALLIALNGHDLLAMISNWDVEHFTAIAREGYAADETGQRVAFFPGLPMLLRVGTVFGLQPAVTGVLIAGVGSAIAAVALMRLGGTWAAVAWLFAPTAVFTTVAYTESLFCALAFWAWERARSDRWVAAALLAAGACSVRISGLFLVGALAVMIITWKKLKLSDRLRRLVLLLLPVLVLAAYASYLHDLTGSWTAWYSAQADGWSRGLTWPWESFMNSWDSIQPGSYAEHPEWVWVFRAEMLSMLLGVLVTIWCLRKKMWAEASWVAVQVLAFSLSYWYMSVTRALLLWFPLWIMLGQWSERSPTTPGGRLRHRILLALVAVISTALMITWSWLYFTGRWSS